MTAPIEASGRRTCLHCGGTLPDVAWWKKLLALDPPPFHDPDGPMGESCWRGLNQRLGITEPGPKPTR